MYVGLALTVLAAIVPIAVEGISETLTTHVRAGRPDATATETMAQVLGLSLYLLLAGAAGVVGWLVSIRGVKREQRWARPVAAALFGLATVAGLGVLMAKDDEATVISPLLPTWVGVLGLVPCIAGAVALVLMWRRS